MTIAALSYAKFCSDVTHRQRVYAFTDQGEPLVCPIGDARVVPFWSSRSRLERIVQALPLYARYQITEFSISEFERCLEHCHSNHLQVGVNWVGAGLVGFNVSVETLRAALASRSGQ